MPQPRGIQARRISMGELATRMGAEQPADRDMLFLRVIRPDDLVVLEIGWSGLELEVGTSGDTSCASLVTDGTNDGVLIARFPPQAIEEDAFFEEPVAEEKIRVIADPGREDSPPPKELPTSDWPDVANSRLAAPSRLAFTVPHDYPPIPFTIAGLLAALMNLPLRVHPSALPRSTPPLRLSVRDVVEAGLTTRALSGVQVDNQLEQPDAQGSGSALSPAERAIHRRIIEHLGAASIHPSYREAAVYARLERFRAESLLVPHEPLATDLLREIVGTAARVGPRMRWHRPFRPPTLDETAIELPYKLILSPHAGAGFKHETLASPVAPMGRVELWHSRLGTKDSTGVNEVDDAARTVRAVWARSGFPLGLSFRPGEPDQGRDLAMLRQTDPPYTSLDADDRWCIVHLTANFDHAGYRPEPVDVGRLMLSSMGGWLDSIGKWTPDRGYSDIALSEWRHLSTMGRDHYVRVVREGMLFPFGHRAALVKVTERRFHPDRAGNPAYLRQRMYIVVRQRDRTYAAPGLPSGDGEELYERTLPFHLIRIRTLVTPPLRDPNSCQLNVPSEKDPSITEPLQLDQPLFWPRVRVPEGGDTPFLFDMVAETPDGGLVEFLAPAIFASFDASKGGDPATRNLKLLPRVCRAYEEEPASKVALHGQRVCLAASKTDGDTSFAIETLSFSAHIPAPADLPKLDSYYEVWATEKWRPGFFPKVRELQVHLPAAQVLTGSSGPATARFASAFAAERDEAGFSAQRNRGEVFLQILDGTTLDFSSKGDKSGGLVQPNIQVKGVSRLLGPVSGTTGADGLDTIAKGQFTPSEFFSGPLGPKLFGVIPLSAVIDAVGLDHLDATPKFITQVTKPLDSLLTSVNTLAGQAQALKQKADEAGALVTEASAVSDGLTKDVANIGADAAALLADPTSTKARDALTADLTSLSQHLQDISDLVDKLPAGVALEARNQIRNTVASLRGLLANIATYVDAVLSALKLADELTVRFDWSPKLKEFSVFVPKNQRTNQPASLVISVEANAKSRVHPEPTIAVSARMTDFTVELIKDLEGFLRLSFNRIEFLAPAGKKPDVIVDFGGVEFIGCLSFVEALRRLIPLDGFTDPPALTVNAEGVKADYSLALPSIAFGVFTLQNLSLGAGFCVPFIGKPLSTRFHFCERQAPFLLTVSAFGGGGFFLIAVDPQGVQMLEAGFEFGASIAMNFGVASGEVHVMGGFVYAIVDGNASLTGYLRIGGCVRALGIVSVSIELTLSLHFEPSSGKCVGKATLTIEIEVTFFSVPVTISCERKFAGSSGDPTFAEIMAPSPGAAKPWDIYCDAFGDDA